MRTTITLPDALAAQAKASAAAEGRTFTSLVEEDLRAALMDGGAGSRPEPLPAYGDPNGHLLVDLANRDALWAALDE